MKRWRVVSMLWPRDDGARITPRPAPLVSSRDASVLTFRVVDGRVMIESMNNYASGNKTAVQLSAFVAGVDQSIQVIGKVESIAVREWKDGAD